MDPIFISSENKDTYNLHKLLFNITDKIHLTMGDKILQWKNIKISFKNNKLEISAPAWVIHLNCLTDHILYQTFTTNMSIKRYLKHLSIISQLKIKYVNKIKKRHLFKWRDIILNFLTPETKAFWTHWKQSN